MQRQSEVDAREDALVVGGGVAMATA